MKKELLDYWEALSYLIGIFATIPTYGSGYPIEHYATKVGSVYAPIFVEPGYSYGVIQERGYGGVSQNGIVIFALKK